MFNNFLLIASALLIGAILFSKLGNKVGLPYLLLFLIVGLTANICGINFYDFQLAQNAGVVAISYILFMGGISINTTELKPILPESISLATIGVFITAIVTGLVAYTFLKIPLKECLLLGSIISSTDAATVFSVLRSKKITLSSNLKVLLEFESGSNDPMALFLTLSAIALIASSFNPAIFVANFFWQFISGVAFGYLIAKITVWLINAIKLEYDGLYVALTMSIILFTYSFTTLIGGNGFLSVYVCGLTMASMRFINKKLIVKFHDAFAWIMQIAMFLVLGLLVNLDISLLVKSFGVALVLTFIARPIAVFLLSRRNLPQKLMISWVGLRGAAPIVLATFPLAFNIPYATEIFNIVFFVVIFSILLQGSTIPYVAKVLKVETPMDSTHKSILEYDGSHTNNKMIEFVVPTGSEIVGKMVSEIRLPEGSLITLIYKNGNYIVPKSTTKIDECDVLFVLSDIRNEMLIKEIICKIKD